MLLRGLPPSLDNLSIRVQALLEGAFLLVSGATPDSSETDEAALSSSESGSKSEALRSCSKRNLPHSAMAPGLMVH